MARDNGLEALLSEQLDGRPGITDKALFGGWVWLCRGHMLCGARHDGLLARVGRDGEGWALRLPGVETMTVGPRPMPGWLRIRAEALSDDDLRALIDAALAFVATLPDKEAVATPPRTRQARPPTPKRARPARHQKP